MTCRSCGTNIADKAIVCYKCGTPTADLASLPRHAPPAPTMPWLPLGALVGMIGFGLWGFTQVPEGSWARLAIGTAVAGASAGLVFLVWRVSRAAGSGRLRRK